MLYLLDKRRESTLSSSTSTGCYTGLEGAVTGSPTRDFWTVAGFGWKPKLLKSKSSGILPLKIAFTMNLRSLPAILTVVGL